jgi:hypothetical protein
LLKKLDPISAPRSLANAAPRAASSFPRGEDLVSGPGEKLLIKTDLVEGDGFQQSALEYPDLSKKEIFESVERFYHRYYLRPKPILRIAKTMLEDKDVCVRRLREGYEFFKSMAQRRTDLAAARGASATHTSVSQEIRGRKVCSAQGCSALPFDGVPRRGLRQHHFALLPIHCDRQFAGMQLTPQRREFFRGQFVNEAERGRGQVGAVFLERNPMAAQLLGSAAGGVRAGEDVQHGACPPRSAWPAGARQQTGAGRSPGSVRRPLLPPPPLTRPSATFSHPMGEGHDEEGRQLFQEAPARSTPHPDPLSVRGGEGVAEARGVRHASLDFGFQIADCRLPAPPLSVAKLALVLWPPASAAVAVGRHGRFFGRQKLAASCRSFCIRSD